VKPQVRLDKARKVINLKKLDIIVRFTKSRGEEVGPGYGPISYGKLRICLCAAGDRTIAQALAACDTNLAR
jgi:hypothetical protein